MGRQSNSVPIRSVNDNLIDVSFWILVFLIIAIIDVECWCDEIVHLHFDFCAKISARKFCAKQMPKIWKQKKCEVVKIFFFSAAYSMVSIYVC